MTQGVSKLCDKQLLNFTIILLYNNRKYLLMQSFGFTRVIAEVDIIEREDGVTMEESAGAISAMEVFNPKKKRLW